MNIKEYKNLKVGDKVKFIKRPNDGIYSMVKIGEIFKIIKIHSSDYVEMIRLKDGDSYGISDNKDEKGMEKYKCFGKCKSTLKEFIENGI